MYLTSYGNDSIQMRFGKESSYYTILNYVDAIGCMSCRLQLPRCKEMISELDSFDPQRVSCLMVFYPKAKKQLIKHLRNNQFAYFVFIDEKDTLNRMNRFLFQVKRYYPSLVVKL